MERRSRPVPVVADPDRPLGEKLRTINATEVLEKPKLKDAWSLGDKLRRANPNLANKPKTNDHNKSEIAQLDLVKILKSIGTVVKGKYIQDPVCQLALKHMARHIREDRHNDKLTVRLHLVSAGVVETNLIPMLLATPADDKLWQLCLSVMYELTVPPAVILRTIPKDKVEDSPWLKIYLREYDDKRQAAKRLFVDVKFFELLCNHLKTILTAEERTREQTNFVGNALRLLRNIFEMRGETDRGVDRETPALIHDKVFCALDQSGIAAILLWLSSADEEEDFVLDVLEVIHALLYDFDPEAFGQTGKTEKELQESQRVIRDMRAREEAVRAASLLKASSRHSAFGGSFTVKGSKAVNPDNEIVLIRPVTAIMNNKFELTADKQAQAKAHNKKAMKSVVERKEAPAVVSEALRTFCTRFLNLSYNVFMQNAKAAIGYVPAEDADEQHSRYFWALRFFTAFARVHNVGVQFISETISTESFHFVHSKLEAYTDLIITDKTQIALWSNRSHLALRSYLELLMMLAAMGTNPDEKVQRAAKQIEINLFYVAEYREIFFKLLKEFKESKFSRAYLKDLVITIHIFLKLLEVYLKKQHHLFVKKKQRAKKGAGKKAVKAKPQKISKITDEARKEIWNSQLEALRTVLQGVMDDPDGIEECVPFDTVSDVAVEQQTDVGRRRIQMALLEKESTRAVALLVASKKCWPIQVDLFGSVGDSVDSDLKRLNKMLLDVLPDLIEELPEPEVLEVIEEGYDAGLDGSRQDIAEDETEADGSDGHKQEASVKDVEFHLESFLKRFATPSHVEPYFLLLKDYPNNTFPVNHAILKMMHRIAVDLLLPGMLFQVSLFRLYHRLLKQEHPTGDPRFHAELRQFMQFILGKFFEKMREDPKAGILSILFWKSRYEAHELVEGPTEKPQQLKLKKSVADDSGKAVLERFAVDREGGEDVVVEGVARWNRAESPEDDDGVDVFSRLRDMDADRSGSPDGGALISRKKPAAKRRRGKAREPSEELVATSSSHDDDGGPRVDDAVEQDEDALGRLNELEVEARKRAEVKRQRMENARLKASGKRRVLRPDSDNDDEADAQAVISPDGSSSSKENVEDDGLEYEFAATQPPTEEEEDAEDAPIRTALKGAKKRVFDEDDEDSNNSNSGPAATSSEPSPQPVPKKARSAYVAYDDSDEDEESSRRPKLVMSVDDE